MSIQEPRELHDYLEGKAYGGGGNSAAGAIGRFEYQEKMYGPNSVFQSGSNSSPYIAPPIVAPSTSDGPGFVAGVIALFCGFGLIKDDPVVAVILGLMLIWPIHFVLTKIVGPLIELALGIAFKVAGIVFLIWLAGELLT